jgi:hypothetical protein
VCVDRIILIVVTDRNGGERREKKNKYSLTTNNHKLQQKARNVMSNYDFFLLRVFLSSLPGSQQNGKWNSRHYDHLRFGFCLQFFSLVGWRVSFFQHCTIMGHLLKYRHKGFLI